MLQATYGEPRPEASSDPLDLRLGLSLLYKRLAEFVYPLSLS